MEQCFWRQVAKIDRFHQIKQRITYNPVMWGIRLNIANLVYFQMLHLQVTCKIQNQRQEVRYAYFAHTCVPISWMCKKQTPGSRRSSESQIIALDASLRVDRLRALQFEGICFENITQQAGQGTPWASHTRKSHSVSFTVWLVFCVSQWITSHSTFPTVHTQPNSTHSKIVREWSKWATKGQIPNLGLVTRTYRVGLNCLFERSKLNTSIFMKIRANNRSSGGYVDKGDVHHSAVAFTVDFVANQTTLCESNNVLSFCRKPFSYSALGKPQAMPQVMTQPENVDQIWSQYAPKGAESKMRSGQSLKPGAIEQMWVSLYSRRGIFLQGCSSSRKLREHMQVDTVSQMLRKHRVCETISLFNGELSKAEVHVFSDSVLCTGKRLMNELEIRYTKRWNDYLKRSMHGEMRCRILLRLLNRSPQGWRCRPVPDGMVDLIFDPMHTCRFIAWFLECKIQVEQYSTNLTRSFLRHLGHHRNENDVHCAGANRVQNRQTIKTICTRREVSQEHVWHRSYGGNVLQDGRIGERRPHAPHHSRRN